MPQHSAYAESSLKSFDAAVRESRLEMRAFCGLLQDLMKKPDTQNYQKSIDHISMAIALWERVQRNFQEDPPEEYKDDIRFKQRLMEIFLNMEAMKANLANGSFEKSFKVCALSCELLVKMHEENGIVGASDHLFHLRKLMKSLKTEMVSQGTNVDPRTISQLQARLDQVQLSSCPAPDDLMRCKNFISTMKKVTASFYDFAVATKRKELKEAETLLDQLITLINEAYGLAI